MSDFDFSKAPDEYKGAIIEFQDRKTTWAGEGVLPNGLLFGSQDGFVYQSLVEGPTPNHTLKASDEGESINGVAHARHGQDLYIGATTRSTIKVLRLTPNTIPRSVRLNRGAHGIYPTFHEGFIIPLGPDGVMTITPGADGSMKQGELRSASGSPYFYKLASLGYDHAAGNEVFAAACRTNGLVIVGVPPHSAPVSLKCAKLRGNPDIVDVCSIGYDANPRAFVALGKDRSMHFIQDAVRNPVIQKLDFPLPVGTAYRVRSARGHLFMLTSKGIYVMPDVAARFQRGGGVGGFLNVMELPYKAIDFTIAFGRWLLIVTPAYVIRADLDEILPSETPALHGPVAGAINLPSHASSIKDSDPWSMQPSSFSSVPFSEDALAFV